MKKKGPTREEVRLDRMAKAHQIEQMRRAAALAEVAKYAEVYRSGTLNRAQKQWARAKIAEWSEEAEENGASRADIATARGF
jgi:hypothetical protein